jgi:hypothetical protein
MRTLSHRRRPVGKTTDLGSCGYTRAPREAKTSGFFDLTAVTRHKKSSPKAPLCVGRTSSVSGSHDRRARGREDRANTQPLLWGRGMTEPQQRRRAAARRWATGWLAPGGQASPRQPPQRWPSLEERGETSTRFRSTKVEKGPAPDAARRGASRRVLRRVTTRRLCVTILHAAVLSIT